MRKYIPKENDVVLVKRDASVATVVKIDNPLSVLIFDGETERTVKASNLALLQRFASEITGNILGLAKEGHFDYVVHGCNCFAAMGGGLAWEVARTYPEVELADKNYSNSFPTKKNKRKMTGTWKAISVNGNKTSFFIVNAYTQFYPGSDFKMEYLKKFLLSFKKTIKKTATIIDKPIRVAFPKIGCGIGGGVWEEVKAVIEETLDIKEIEVTFVYFPVTPKTPSSFKFFKSI